MSSNTKLCGPYIFATADSLKQVMYWNRVNSLQNHPRKNRRPPCGSCLQLQHLK